MLLNKGVDDFYNMNFKLHWLQTFANGSKLKIIDMPERFFGLSLEEEESRIIELDGMPPEREEIILGCWDIRILGLYTLLFWSRNVGFQVKRKINRMKLSKKIRVEGSA